MGQDTPRASRPGKPGGAERGRAVGVGAWNVVLGPDVNVCENVGPSVVVVRVLLPATDSSSSPSTRGPVGGRPDAVAVLSTAPASTSACLHRSVMPRVCSNSHARVWNAAHCRHPRPGERTTEAAAVSIGGHTLTVVSTTGFAGRPGWRHGIDPVRSRRAGGPTASRVS